MRRVAGLLTNSLPAYSETCSRFLAARCVSRTANRAVLEDAAGLAGNRSRAEALSHAAEGELALLREQLELALQLQVGQVVGQHTLGISGAQVSLEVGT